jgi:hypothetical protein
MAINYRHDFHAFSPLRCADLRPATAPHTSARTEKEKPRTWGAGLVEGVMKDQKLM